MISAPVDLRDQLPRPHHHRPSRQMRRIPSDGGSARRAHSHRTGPAQPRAADQDPHRRGSRPPNQDPRTRRSRRPPPARPDRRRTHHRRANLHRLVTPRPLAQRSSIRPPRRRRPTRSILRSEHPPPPQLPSATANSTEPCTPSPSSEAATAPRPRPTSPNEPPKAKPPDEPNAASHRYIARQIYRAPRDGRQNQHLSNIEASFQGAGFLDFPLGGVGDERPSP